MALNYDVFRQVVAPEFANKENSELDIFASEAEIEISEKVFKKRYPRAVALLTAHLIKISEMAQNQAGGATGPLKRTKVGKLEREYENSMDAVKDNGSYELTSYGKEFLRLRRQVLKGPKFVTPS